MEAKKEKKNKSKRNPLFVVTNNGQDVESADNFLDAFAKKLGLTPVVEFFETIFQMIIDNVTSYAALVALKDFLDDLLEEVITIQEKIEDRLGPYSELASARIEGLMQRLSSLRV